MKTLSSNLSLKTEQVTVIIVNWNCNDVLSKCVAHLRNQTMLPHRIIVMDNGSNDGSLQSIGHYDVEICLLGENLGFAAANNRGLTECNTDFVALLNPDAFPEPDWLERLLDAADSHPDVSAFASLQLCDERPEFIDGAGDSYHVSGRVWRNRHLARLSPADQRKQSIFSPCAAAALYRRQALIEVGGFDEDYFCYVEDVDLGFRLRLAGHQAMYVHDAIVHHVGSVSAGGPRSDFCVYHGHRNLVWTYIKNMPGILFWLFLPLHLLLNVVSVIYFVSKGQSRVILRAKVDAIKGIPKMWQKRKLIQKQRVASVFDIFCHLDKRIFPVK